MGKFKPKYTGMEANERSEEKERLMYVKLTKKKKLRTFQKCGTKFNPIAIIEA